MQIVRACFLWGELSDGANEQVAYRQGKAVPGGLAVIRKIQYVLE